MFKPLFLLLAALAAFGDGDPWDKVRQLQRGSELRIYQVGEKQPVAAKFEAVSPESLIVIRQTTQTAIPKERIERVDWRPPSGSRVAARTQKIIGTPEEAATQRSKGSTLPPRSTAGSVKIKPKPGFETVYEREAVVPQK